jgi:glycosyltransferase involved in cell wall biosynthesis
MRVALVLPWFSENMGYLGNTLPKYLAREGADVHVIVTDLPHNYQIKEYRSVYGSAGRLIPLRAGEVREVDGYTLHVMHHATVFGQVRIPGLLQALRVLNPDVVQVLVPIGLIALEVAFGRAAQGYRMFTGSHRSASTFPLAQGDSSKRSLPRLKCFLTRGLHGRFVSKLTEKCYAVTQDCADIAITFFGVERSKVEVMHLCTEVERFHPAVSPADFEQRRSMRQRLGFKPDEIVCIYTGKLTIEKNALVLAEAVADLRADGLPYRALIIGSGPQTERISAENGSLVLPFFPYSELPPFYRCADIGVWPTNESTSMLDAAASGLPLVVSDGIVYRDHVNGNGLVVRMNDRADLKRVLLTLNDGDLRGQLGRAGAAKMAMHFNCQDVARRRLSDYSAAVGKRQSGGSNLSKSVGRDMVSVR